MNIMAQTCGLLLLGILIYFYISQPKVDFKSSRIFFVALLSDVFCLVFDLISSISISYSGTVFSDKTVLFLCRLYLVLLVFMAYTGFVYAVSLMPLTEKGGRRINYAAAASYAVSVILVFALPISYRIENIYTYSYGPACSVAYIFAPFYMIMTFCIAFYYRWGLAFNVFVTIAFWIWSEMGCAVVQFIFPRMLLVGYASAIGLAVIYLELENPALQIDKSTGLFNLSTLQMYIEDFYKKDLSFSYIIVRLTYDTSSPRSLVDSSIKQTAAYLRLIKRAKVFYIGQSEFMLIFRDIESMQFEAATINKELKLMCGRNNTDYTIIEDPAGRRASSLIEIREMAGQDIISNRYQDNNIYEITDEIYEKFREEKNIIKEIDTALAEDRIEAFFQPIYSISEGTFCGAEALARIRKKDGTLLSPGLFIPVAEKTGQVTKIGDRMFEKTLEVIKDNKAGDLGVRFIDVNLSALQCEDKTLATRYLNAMEKAGVSPSMFCFEITETAMIGSRKHAMKNLEAFRKAGCSCSLDDFGNGESNLNYVIDLPINFIKADRSMVIKYTTSKRVNLVLSLMVNMAKDLSLKIVTEGVENETDLKAMKDLAIDYIQGFYFSKPLPKAEYLAFLKEKNKAA